MRARLHSENPEKTPGNFDHSHKGSHDLSNSCEPSGAPLSNEQRFLMSSRKKTSPTRRRTMTVAAGASVLRIVAHVSTLAFVQKLPQILLPNRGVGVSPMAMRFI
jgi:hypothetical protein